MGAIGSAGAADGGVMTETKRGWVGFWSAGRWWKAVLLIAVYWGVYQLLGLLCGTVFASQIDRGNFLDPGTLFFGEIIPILISGLLLLLFARSVRWLGDLFGPQPVPRRPWMWLAVVLVLIPIVIRLVATEWSAYSVVTVLTILLLGLCVGFTEELATRGLVVTMLRKGGSGERLAFVLSSLLFALLHSGNVLSGQAPLLVLITVIYTFGFGAMMYLSLRATGRLYWAMLLHAATDPTTILATGGIDGHSASAGSAGLIGFAGLFNWAYIIFALVAIFLVKRHYEGQRAHPRHGGATSADAPG